MRGHETYWEFGKRGVLFFTGLEPRGCSSGSCWQPSHDFIEPAKEANMENRAKMERDRVPVIINLYIKPHTSASNFSFGLNQSDLGFLSFANKRNQSTNLTLFSSHRPVLFLELLAQCLLIFKSSTNSDC